MKLYNTQSKTVLVTLSIYIHLYLYHKFLNKKLYNLRLYFTPEVF